MKSLDDSRSQGLTSIVGRVIGFLKSTPGRKAVAEARRDRDLAFQELTILKQHHWRALNVLAALNDLQSRTLGDLERREFLATWNTAWNKPLGDPPNFDFKEFDAGRK